MISLRRKLYITVSAPSGLAIAAFYASTLTDGGDAAWLFRMGLTFVILAVMLGRLTWLGHRQHILEDRCDNLARRLRELAVDQDQIRDEVNSHLIVKQWRQSMGDRRIRLVRSEDN